MGNRPYAGASAGHSLYQRLIVLPSHSLFVFISEANNAQGNVVRRDSRATYNWGLSETALKDFLKRYQDPKAQ